MSAKLSMSLDDIVKQERELKSRISRADGNRGGRGRSGRGGRGGRGRKGGPIRRTGKSASQGGLPYSRAEQDNTWGHDGFEQQNGNGTSTRIPKRKPISLTTGQFGTSISIANLKYDVLESDLKELMEKVGTVHQVKIFYDKSGRSEGRAVVIFGAKADAERAIKEYDGVAIDDQAMQLEMLGRSKVSQGWRSDSFSNTSDSWRDEGNQNTQSQGGNGNDR